MKQNRGRTGDTVVIIWLLFNWEEVQGRLDYTGMPLIQLS